MQLFFTFFLGLTHAICIIFDFIMRRLFSFFCCCWYKNGVVVSHAFFVLYLYPITHSFKKLWGNKGSLKESSQYMRVTKLFLKKEKEAGKRS